MAIRTVRVWQMKMPYYYRFTCEKCGCRTHWITGEITVEENEQSSLAQSMNDRISRIQKELDDCCAGKRMLVGDVTEWVHGALSYFGEAKCPRCKEIPSWAPRLAPGLMKRKQQKNSDAFNATPVLCRPEVVFGGDLPEPDEPDFMVPCRLEIHGSSFGVPHASPVYLNGEKIGETDQSSVDISVETRYRDNLIIIYQNPFTSYIEAEEGKTLQLQYKNFMVRKVEEGE